MRLVERVSDADRRIGQDILVLKGSVKCFLLASVAQGIILDFALFIEPVNALLDACFNSALLKFVSRVQRVALVGFPRGHELRERAAGHFEGTVCGILILASAAGRVNIKADLHAGPRKPVHGALALRRREPRHIARYAARAGDRGNQHIQRNRDVPRYTVNGVENIIGDKVPHDRRDLG